MSLTHANWTHPCSVARRSWWRASRRPLREAGDVVLAIADGSLTPVELVPMRDVVTGAVAVPTDRPMVFKSVGMSWQDLVVAEAVLEHSTM